MESENKSNQFYQTNQLEIGETEEGNFGDITEQDKLLAAKQILLWIAIIYIFTVIGYLIRPEVGNNLLEIAKTSLPPLATLIIAFYFKDKGD